MLTSMMRKMKRSLFFWLGLLLAAAGLLFTGCGIRYASGGQLLARYVEADGPQDREVFTPGSFTAIELRGNGNVTLTRGSPQVVIEGSRNQLDLISVRIEENTLIVEPLQKVSFQPGLDITISLSRLTGFDSYGVFNLTTTGTPLDASNVVFEIKGSGNYSFVVNGSRITASHNGFGTVQFTGVASSLVADVNATGSFDARNLLVEEAEVEVNGVGNAFVYASEKLTARANGVGSITYRGSPPVVEKKIRGVGRIVARQ